MGLGGLPQVLDTVLDTLGMAGGRPPVDYDRLFAKVGETVAASAKGLVRAALYGSLARREYFRKDSEVALLLVWARQQRRRRPVGGGSGVSGG